LIGHRLIDDHDRRAGGCFLPGELATALQRDSHRLKISAGRGAILDDRGAILLDGGRPTMLNPPFMPKLVNGIMLIAPATLTPGTERIASRAGAQVSADTAAMSALM
jgi:hypothetical protein